MPTKIEWADEDVLRFWSYVNKTTTCWMWTGGTFGGRYGQFRLGRHKVKAHRFSWAIHGGLLPDGSILCHTCDRPLCVNPAHLVLGDNGDNIRDRDIKGHTARGPNPRKGSSGTKNPAAKLNWELVLDIRTLREGGMSLRKIGDRFGVSPSQVRNITTGYSWSQSYANK